MDNSTQNIVTCEHICIREEDENKELGRLESIFQWPDLTLKVGNRKLYITQEEFKQISEVFNKMLTSDFAERKNAEINFSGKDYKTFVMFLRVAHPGLQDPFEEETVHLILPLIDEYLAENARKRADKYLSQLIKHKGDKLTSPELVKSLVEAEKYNLPKYLKACTNAASKKMLKNLTSEPDYQNVSLETRYQISIHRWRETDKALENAARSYNSASRIGELLLNHIQKN